MIYSQDPKVYKYRPGSSCAEDSCSKPVVRDGQRYYCPSCYQELKDNNEKYRNLIIELFNEFGHRESCSLIKDIGNCDCGYSEYLSV